MVSKSHGTQLSPEESEQVRRVVATLGAIAGAESLGVGYQTIARAIARMPVRRGTAEIIRARLAEYARAQSGVPAPRVRAATLAELLASRYPNDPAAAELRALLAAPNPPEEGSAP